jgi:hypothetical protein
VAVPSAVGKAKDRGRETYMASGSCSRLRPRISWAPVLTSSRTTADDSVGDAAMKTSVLPLERKRRAYAVYGRSAAWSGCPGWTNARLSMPSWLTMQAIRPSGRKA